MRRARIKAKRATPRRNDGRVTHGRIKANGRFPDSHVKEYWNSLDRRCVVCGAGDTVIHHIIQSIPQKVRRRDHRFVVVLCKFHHTIGNDSIHLLGSEALFEHRHGVDLVAIAIGNWGNFDE